MEAPEGSDLRAERLERWGQTSETRVPDPASAEALIARLGIVSHFPASSEIPNLYQSHMGDPEARTESKWDTPSGRVYTWRWELGRAEAGFYSTIVRRRPTWVSWDLLPAILRLCGDLRTPDELYDLAMLSPAAYRIAQALEEAGGVLNTGELRQRAGFPMGKDQRTAYLKAIEELDNRLLLGKVFPNGGDEMSHALVYVRYREQVEEADRMTREDAFDRFLYAYLPNAVYAMPTVLARHLRIDETELRAALDRQVEVGTVELRAVPVGKGNYYVTRSRWMSTP